MANGREPGFFFGKRVYAELDSFLANEARNSGQYKTASEYSNSAARMYRSDGNSTAANRELRRAAQDQADASSTITIRSTRSRCCCC